MIYKNEHKQLIAWHVNAAQMAYKIRYKIFVAVHNRVVSAYAVVPGEAHNSSMHFSKKHDAVVSINIANRFHAHYRF